MDILYVILTVIFFALSWAFTVLCDRLSAEQGKIA
jgi:hypothetical protein